MSGQRRLGFLTSSFAIRLRLIKSISQSVHFSKECFSQRATELSGGPVVRVTGRKSCSIMSWSAGSGAIIPGVVGVKGVPVKGVPGVEGAADMGGKRPGACE